jgi:hypothetical protein
MKVELWKISEVKPYPGNPRQNDAAVDAVAASIKEFGFRQPIVVDEAGVTGGDLCGECHCAEERELAVVLAVPPAWTSMQIEVCRGDLRGSRGSRTG